MENGNKSIYPTETTENLHLKKQFQTVVKESGLTKKEYYAGLAMQALISNPNIRRPDKNNTLDYEKFSKVAIEYADSLLKELENK